ncbi:MATE family efflux transporter [Neobittarella massiliensis]
MRRSHTAGGDLQAAPSRDTRRLFFQNVLPAMLAFAFSGVYAIVDGLFIGQNVGDIGLAAINVAYPITAFIQAVGTGVGMSGAIWVSTAMGQKDTAAQRRYLGGALQLLLVCCAAVTALTSLLAVPLLQMFGASGSMLALAQQYIRVIALGASFQLLATGMVPLCRCFNGAGVAMGAMIAGFLTNTVLDWLFVSVYSWGMTGAAVATVLGQGVTVLPCLWHLARKKALKALAVRPQPGAVWLRLGHVGLSPFGLTMSPNIVIIIMNRAALHYGGSEAVACYAVVSYVACVVQLLLQGIGDGCQPLISRSSGAGDHHSVVSLRGMVYRFSCLVAVLGALAVFLLRRQLPALFGVSGGLAPQVASVLSVFCLGFLPMALLRVSTSYFYAVQQNRSAYLLIYSEPVLLALLAGLLLPGLLGLGLTGVWWSIPAEQLLLAALGLWLVYRRQVLSGQQ